MTRQVVLTDREIGLIKCALARYKQFCIDAASAFKGTGHDEHFMKRKDSISELQDRFYEINNETQKENQNAN